MKINAGTKIKLYQQIVIFAKHYIQCTKEVFNWVLNITLIMSLLEF
jgi:hypothetical protein